MGTEQKFGGFILGFKARRNKMSWGHRREIGGILVDDVEYRVGF